MFGGLLVCSVLCPDHAALLRPTRRRGPPGTSSSCRRCHHRRVRFVSPVTTHQYCGLSRSVMFGVLLGAWAPGSHGIRSSSFAQRRSPLPGGAWLGSSASSQLPTTRRARPQRTFNLIDSLVAWSDAARAEASSVSNGKKENERMVTAM